MPPRRAPARSSAPAGSRGASSPRPRGYRRANVPRFGDGGRPPPALASGVIACAESRAGAQPPTAVTAANDAAGNLTFTVRTNQPALADAVVDVAFDTDQNSQTGGNGVEFVFLIGRAGWEFARWDGNKFVTAAAPSANGSYANGLATFKINKADLGGVETFVFWADTFQLDANGNVIAEDTAPDGTSAYTYTHSKPLTLRAGTTTAVPAAPAAGKAFAVRTRITRGDTGGPLNAGTVTCAVRVGTVPLRATGRVAGGVASCSMALPKTAKGKLVRVTMKVTLQGVSTTKTFSARVR